MKKDEKLTFNVHGINVKLNSNSSGFIEFVKKYYNPFITKIKKVDLEVNVEIRPYLSNEHKWTNNVTTIGKGVQIDKNEKSLYYDDSEVKIRVNNGEKLNVDCVFRPNRLRHWLHLLMFRPSKTKKYYYRKAMKNAIHDPLFYLLETKKGYDLLHAATIANNKHAIVFTGLGGAGKSTLATYLLDKYEIISDNYLLFKKNNCFPFPERLRISKNTLKIVNKKGLKADGEKYYLNTDSTDMSEKPMRAILIVDRSSSFSLRKLGKEEAFEKLFMVNEYTSEFHYHSYMSLMCYLKNTKLTTSERIKRLKELVDSTPIYIVTVRPNICRDVDKIMSKI